MKQSLVGGVVGGLVVALLFLFRPVEEPTLANPALPNAATTSTTTTTTTEGRTNWGQPRPAPWRPNVVDCVDPNNMFTCRIP